MKAHFTLYLAASTMVIILAYPKSDLPATLDATACKLEDALLICDYRDQNEPMVYFGGPFHSSVQKITIHNAQNLRLNNILCKNLELRNVTGVDITPKEFPCDGENCGNGPCEDGIELSVWNSTLVRLPRGVTQLYLEASEVEILTTSHTLRNLTVRNSHIKLFDVISSTVDRSTVIIHNSTVEVLQSLEVGPTSKFMLQNSHVALVKSRAVLVDGGSLVLKKSSVSSTSNDGILLMPKASVKLEEFKGDLNFKVLSNEKIIMQPLIQNTSLKTDSQERNCLPDESYFEAYVAFLVLFIIMTILFLLQLVLKLRRNTQHREITKSDDQIFSAKRAEGPSIMPLLQDSADRAQNLTGLIDTFEDDLMKSVDITKAFYLEDLDDIRSEMRMALDLQKKTDFDEFVRENGKRLELHEFQIKSKSKIDKNTALMERMNQAVRDLIEEQYMNCAFELQNSGEDVKLNHKERIVECNRRFSEDLLEIIKTAIQKWDEELQSDQNSSPHLINYIRHLLSNLLSSTNELGTKLERFILENKEEFQEIINGLEKEYKAKLEMISSVAEERSGLVRTTAKEDTEVFGSKRASRLSIIQEENAITSQSLQQKEAEVEFSEARQKLLLQEKIIHEQEDNMKHLERITMMLADLRRCYIESTNTAMNQNNPHADGHLGSGEDTTSTYISNKTLMAQREFLYESIKRVEK